MTAARPSRPPGMPFVVRQANGSMLLLVVAVPLHTESATPASPANSGSRGVFDHRCMADCCVIVSSVRLDRVHASPLETDYDDGSRVAAADPIPRASRTPLLCRSSQGGYPNSYSKTNSQRKVRG